MIKLKLPKIEKYSDSITEIVINDADNTFMGKFLKREGLANYEPHTIATILHLLERSKSKIFFDIGSNIGIYSFTVAAFLGRSVTIRAFEPMPNLSLISKKISLDNNLNYEVEEIAMGSHCRQGTLYVSQQSDTSNSLLKGFRSSKQEIFVTIETVDSYIERCGLIPVVMKIDTEATEPDVLSGCNKFLSQNRPWIICEVLKGRTEEKLKSVMDKYEYYFYHINAENLWQASSEISGDPTYKFRDWLFAPEKIDRQFVEQVQGWVKLLGECSSGLE